MICTWVCGQNTFFEILIASIIIFGIVGVVLYLGSRFDIPIGETVEDRCWQHDEKKRNRL